MDDPRLDALAVETDEKIRELTGYPLGDIEPGQLAVLRKSAVGLVESIDYWRALARLHVPIAGERGPVAEEQPGMHAVRVRHWHRVIYGRLYSFRAIGMQGGERRYSANVLGGDGDRRFACNWRHAGFWAFPAQAGEDSRG